MNRPLVYRFSNWTGRDFWRNWFSEKRQARWVAKLLMTKLWKNADPNTTPMIIHMPIQAYRVVDQKARIEVTGGDPNIKLLGR